MLLRRLREYISSVPAIKYSVTISPTVNDFRRFAILRFPVRLTQFTNTCWVLIFLNKECNYFYRQISYIFWASLKMFRSIMTFNIILFKYTMVDHGRAARLFLIFQSQSEWNAQKLSQTKWVTHEYLLVTALSVSDREFSHYLFPFVATRCVTVVIIRNICIANCI